MTRGSGIPGPVNFSMYLSSPWRSREVEMRASLGSCRRVIILFSELRITMDLESGKQKRKIFRTIITSHEGHNHWKINYVLFLGDYEPVCDVPCLDSSIFANRDSVNSNSWNRLDWIDI